MEKIRISLALIVMSEILIIIMHFIIGYCLSMPFPLCIYWVIPLIMIFCIVLAEIISPLLNWISGI